MFALDKEVRDGVPTYLVADAIALIVPMQPESLHVYSEMLG